MFFLELLHFSCHSSQILILYSFRVNLEYLLGLNLRGQMTLNFLGSKVHKPSKFSIKTLNVALYIKLNFQNTSTLRTVDPIILYV